MDRRFVLSCVLGIVTLGGVASAAEPRKDPALLEEFLTAEPCYVQSRGEFELSAAFDHRRPGDAWRLPVLVEYGITDRLSAEVEGSYVSLDVAGSRGRGPGDTELGLLYALRPDVSRVALTLGASIGLPTGDEDEGLGSGRSDLELLGIVGVPLGRGELHVTGMLEMGDEEAEPALNAAAVLPAGDLRFTLEGNLSRGGPSGWPDGAPADAAPADGDEEGACLVATPGLFYRPGPEFELGIGVPVGLTETAPDWGIVGRVTFELEF
jgi:hypothetical protein